VKNQDLKNALMLFLIEISFDRKEKTDMTNVVGNTTINVLINL